MHPEVKTTDGTSMTEQIADRDAPDWPGRLDVDSTLLERQHT